MSRLNQINHWNKPTQYKNKLKKIFGRFFSFFFFFCYRTQCITPQLCHSGRERSTGGWHKKTCSKENTCLREALEKIKNHDIKEEDAWRHFFAEINNDCIVEEITWIQTLTPLSALTIPRSYNQQQFLECYIYKYFGFDIYRHLHNFL